MLKTYNTLHSCHNFPAGSRQAARVARICETSLLDYISEAACSQYYLLGLHLLTWFNFYPSLDKLLHPLLSVGWNYLFIPKLQQLHCWSLGMDK